MRFKFVSVLFFGFLSVSCVVKGQELARSSPDLSSWEALWTQALGDNETTQFWTEETVRQIQLEKLAETEPADVQEFCSNYSSLSENDRTGFWLVLVSAMSEKESGHDPSVSFKESFKNSQGEYVVSRGLLQLSRESANGYKCKVDDVSLHDAVVNLSCGVRILARWVKKDLRIHSESISGKIIHRGGARYWSVLRPSSSSLSFIKDATSSSEKCQLAN